MNKFLITYNKFNAFIQIDSNGDIKLYVTDIPKLIYSFKKTTFITNNQFNVCDIIKMSDVLIISGKILFFHEDWSYPHVIILGENGTIYDKHISKIERIK
jgi:hypothetical protein